jgi:hypothetical protein
MNTIIIVILVIVFIIAGFQDYLTYLRGKDYEKETK